MQPKSPKLLEDIRDAAQFVLDETASLTLEDYRADRRLRQAAERNFQIIGEAIRRLRQTDPETAARVGDVRQIIAFRNILMHGYDVIDDAVVWDVIRAKVPGLLDRVRRLLQHESPNP